MIHHRPGRLRMSASVVGLLSSFSLYALIAALSAFAAEPNALPEITEPAGGQTAQQPSAQTPPSPQPQQQQKPPQPPANPPQQKPPTAPNPFENVPEAPAKPTPPNPQTGIQETKPVPIGANVVEEIDFRGQHKIPQDTLRALIFTKKGDTYDEEAIHRDFIALWNTGRFDDLRIVSEKGPQGGIILRFVVTERRTIHTIDYTGNKSISKSEILDRFKDRKVSLTPESQYDPGKVQRAKNVLQEYEAERGHQYASVTPQIRQVPPGGVDVTFAIDEGPKVKVGNIIIDGNTAFKDRDVIRAMKNLKP